MDGARRAVENNLILHLKQRQLVSGTGGETGWDSCVSAAWARQAGDVQLGTASSGEDDGDEVG